MKVSSVKRFTIDIPVADQSPQAVGCLVSELAHICTGPALRDWLMGAQKLCFCSLLIAGMSTERGCLCVTT